MRQPDWAVLCSVPSSVRLASPQRCSPARNGRFARPCDRSTYTYMSSGRSPARLVSFSQVPPRWRRRSKPRMAPSGVRRGARGLGLSPAPCAAAPVVFAAIRAAMLRRRDTASSPCDVSHRASDEPRRRMSLSSALAPSSLASPSIRRVFLRSFCARRCSIDSLNSWGQTPRNRCKRLVCALLAACVSDLPRFAVWGFVI